MLTNSAAMSAAAAVAAATCLLTSFLSLTSTSQRGFKSHIRKTMACSVELRICKHWARTQSYRCNRSPIEIGSCLLYQGDSDIAVLLVSRLSFVSCKNHHIILKRRAQFNVFWNKNLSPVYKEKKWVLGCNLVLNSFYLVIYTSTWRVLRVAVRRKILVNCAVKFNNESFILDY
jgi:hypothetical protein